MDVACGMAVLRGADIFKQGILGASTGKDAATDSMCAELLVVTHGASWSVISVDLSVIFTVIAAGND